MESKDKNWFNKDPHWIWGIFYYNKEDKRLFPPKRKPFFGWTVNFANPKSILVFILMLVAFYLLIHFIEFKKKNEFTLINTSLLHILNSERVFLFLQ